MIVGAAALGGAAVIVLVTGLASKGKEVTPGPAQAGSVALPMASVTSEPATPSPALSSVLVVATSGSGRSTHTRVSASPPSARIYVDDIPVTNPYAADHASDPVAHRLRIEAEGYETKTRIVTFADDVDLKLALAPLPRSPAKRAPKPTRPADVASPSPRPAAAVSVRVESPPPRAASAAPAATRTARPIETGDPYANP